jgi:glyoxylase-like metal-dependent hydrolase (beta-lactamase superfamily II)
MTQTRWLLVLTLAAFAGCAQLTPEQQIVNDAAAALGGRERVAAVRTLTVEGEGTLYNLGQDMRPGASGQTFTAAGFKRTLDVSGARMRTEYTRTPNFQYFQGQQPQRIVQGQDGEVGYNIGANGNPARIGAAAARDRRAELYHHPIPLIRHALAEGTQVTNARTDGGERLVDIALAGGPTLTLAVDGSGVPTRIQFPVAHPNLGDVTVSTSLADYQEVNGLRLPGRLVTKTDDFTTAEIRIAKQTVDADAGDLAAPAALTAAAPPAAAAPNVVAEVVAPGVWLLAGQGAHSVVAEFSDHLVLIEAPTSEARTLAVIAKAKELVAGKPLRRVVTTHHHFDHTAGIRAAIAEGMTIVTQSGNEAFFEEVAQRPHTISPDTLAKNPRPVTVETVDDELVLKDAAMTMVLYHVAGNPHSETMLMAHFPAAKVIVEVDAYSPGSQVNPYAGNLADNITKRKLAVDRIVPLHGAIAPIADLLKLRVQTTNRDRDATTTSTKPGAVYFAACTTWK